MVGLRGIKQAAHMILVLGNIALEKVLLRAMRRHLAIMPAIFRSHIQGVSRL